MKVHTEESLKLQSKEEEIANKVRKTERELFKLVHKLDDTGYKSKQDQIKDAIKVGQLAEKYDKLSTERMEVFNKMMEAMETK